MKLDLTDVTLCAVDSVNVGPAARALDRSVTQCRFADAVLFSHQAADGPFRTVRIDRIGSTHAYSNFVFKHLPGFIETPFVLIVQWDGYVIDRSAWSPSFRDYDYIGAPWSTVRDGMTVGNGGFSLRSRKFMSATTEEQFPLREGENSDWLMCRAYRPKLESDFGIRFAPEPVADGFSYETVAAADFTKHRPPTFGFHGLGNMWRYLGDADMIALVDRLSPYVFLTRHYACLVTTYFLLGKFEMFAALSARMKAEGRSEALLETFRAALGDNDTARRCAATADRLMRYRGSARLFAVKLMEGQRRAALSIARLRGQKSSFEL